jgi:hypothetical protein
MQESHRGPRGRVIHYGVSDAGVRLLGAPVAPDRDGVAQLSLDLGHDGAGSGRRPSSGALFAGFPRAPAVDPVGPEGHGGAEPTVGRQGEPQVPGGTAGDEQA